MTGQHIGPYRVLREIGRGGMGAVFEAVHEQIERHVAIKVLRPEYGQNQQLVARFFNGTRAANPRRKTRLPNFREWPRNATERARSTASLKDIASGPGLKSDKINRSPLAGSRLAKRGGGVGVRREPLRGPHLTRRFAATSSSTEPISALYKAHSSAGTAFMRDLLATNQDVLVRAQAVGYLAETQDQESLPLWIWQEIMP